MRNQVTKRMEVTCPDHLGYAQNSLYLILHLTYYHIFPPVFSKKNSNCRSDHILLTSDERYWLSEVQPERYCIVNKHCKTGLFNDKVFVFCVLILFLELKTFNVGSFCLMNFTYFYQ